MRDKKKEILIGKTKDGEAVTLEFSLEQSYRDADSQYFAISGTRYDLTDIINEEDGEDRAKEYLEDGEGWKMAVEGDHTTLGKDEWIDHVLDVDGWQHVIGDIYEVADGKYVRWSSGGQIDVDDEFEVLLIQKEELDFILKAWKALHIKEYKTMTDEQKEMAQKVKEIFEKYKDFDYYQIGQFIEE